MHDFIQALSFNDSRTPFVPRPTAPDWVQRGIMRSFDEDVVAYRPSPRNSGRTTDRPRRRNRR